MFGTQWTIHTGFSYGYSHNDIGLNKDNVTNGEHSSHLKLKLRKSFSERVKLTFGADYFITDFTEDYRQPAGMTNNLGYNNSIAAAYAETDIFCPKSWLLKPCQNSYSDLLKEGNVETRAALAYKVVIGVSFHLLMAIFHQRRTRLFKYYKDLSTKNSTLYL